MAAGEGVVGVGEGEGFFRGPIGEKGRRRDDRKPRILERGRSTIKEENLEI